MLLWPEQAQLLMTDPLPWTAQPLPAHASAQKKSRKRRREDANEVSDAAANAGSALDPQQHQSNKRQRTGAWFGWVAHFVYKNLFQPIFSMFDRSGDRSDLPISESDCLSAITSTESSASTTIKSVHINNSGANDTLKEGGHSNRQLGVRALQADTGGKTNRNTSRMRRVDAFETFHWKGYLLGPGDIYGGDYCLYKGNSPNEAHSVATVLNVQSTKVIFSICVNIWCLVSLLCCI